METENKNEPNPEIQNLWCRIENAAKLFREAALVDTNTEMASSGSSGTGINNLAADGAN